MRRELAVVPASGGMDSCVTVALAAREYSLALLHLNYGQRTETRELQAFNDIADFCQAEHRLVISMEHLASIGGSSLTDRSIPVSLAALRSKGIPTSYVPFRNANSLSAAVSWAEVPEASAVSIGAAEEDSSGYPDCRREFYRAFQEVVRVGTKPTSGITILTPVIGMQKDEIVRTGIALGAPLHLSWSCYQREDIGRAICDSCALRLRGFQRAGVEDPVQYEQRPLYT